MQSGEAGYDAGLFVARFAAATGRAIDVMRRARARASRESLYTHTEESTVTYGCERGQKVTRGRAYPTAMLLASLSMDKPVQ